MGRAGRRDCLRKNFDLLATRVKSGGNEGQARDEARGQDVVYSDGAGGVTWSNVADSEATARAHLTPGFQRLSACGVRDLQSMLNETTVL